jgi:hypothetical protein
MCGFKDLLVARSDNAKVLFPEPVGLLKDALYVKQMHVRRTSSSNDGGI